MSQSKVTGEGLVPRSGDKQKGKGYMPEREDEWERVGIKGVEAGRG